MGWRLLRPWLIWLALAGLVSACSSASRALVHEEDMNKVFPWPRDKQTISIRVKPMTTMAKTCFLFGSFVEVEVTPRTTFYIVDESEKNFAYTPDRSPVRRLVKIKSIQILWPQAAGPDQAESTKEQKQQEEQGGEEAPQPGK